MLEPKSENTKIALFLPNLSGGGAERITVYLAEGFAKKGFQTDLVLSQAIGPYLSQVSPDVNLVDLDVPRALLSVKSLAHYLRAKKPTAIISALNYTNLLALLAARLSGFRGKTIVTIHNQLTVPSEKSPSLKAKVIMSLMRRFYSIADEIVAVSNGVADDASSVLNLRRDRVKTIYNPVISDAVLARGKEMPNDDWLKTPGPPVALAIGRLHEQKDFPNLLRAFRHVRDKLECRLIILGEGPDRPELESLVRELKLENSVKLPGFVDNPYAYLNYANVFVLSSKWEGLPTVLIEALAFGKAIVSTNCKSGPDEILQNGEFGALVPIGDSKALAEAIHKAMLAPIQYNAVQARKRFTYERSIESYLDLILQK